MLASRVVRGMVPVALVALLLPLAPVATADPADPPTTVAGLLGRYYDLSHEAEKVNEELLRIQEDVAAKRGASNKATEQADAAHAAADTARTKAKTAREDMDRVTALLSGRQGSRGLSTFVVSNSPDDVLVRMEAASLAGQVSGRVVEFGGAALAEAERTAQDAARAKDEARAAEAAVADGAGKVEAQKAELDRQVAEVRTALDRLTPDQRSLLATSEYTAADVKIPTGDVGAVIRFALSSSASRTCGAPPVRSPTTAPA